MAGATETFVRALQELSDCVPNANIHSSQQHLIGDLDYLVDSCQLVANAHQVWADRLHRELEEPLIGSVSQIMSNSKV